MSDLAGHPVNALLHGAAVLVASVLLDIGDDSLGLLAGFLGIPGLFSALSPGVLDVSFVDGFIETALHGGVESHLASLQDILRDSLTVLSHHLICLAQAFATSVRTATSPGLSGSLHGGSLIAVGVARRSADVSLASRASTLVVFNAPIGICAITSTPSLQAHVTFLDVKFCCWLCCYEGKGKDGSE